MAFFDSFLWFQVCLPRQVTWSTAKVNRFLCFLNGCRGKGPGALLLLIVFLVQGVFAEARGQEHCKS